MWERAQSFHSFSLVPFSPHLYMLTNPEALWTKSFWVFIETSLHRHGWLYHWPLAADPTSSPSPIPRGQEGWDWKFQSSNHTIGSYGNQPASFSSVQFSHSVVSDSFRPHGLQHTRPPCPSSTPQVYSNSCSLSWWCHPTISSSVTLFSLCLQSFPASGSFPSIIQYCLL